MVSCTEGTWLSPPPPLHALFFPSHQHLQNFSNSFLIFKFTNLYINITNTPLLSFTNKSHTISTSTFFIILPFKYFHIKLTLSLSTHFIHILYFIHFHSPIYFLPYFIPEFQATHSSCPRLSSPEISTFV
eukprot:Phypoly_transcript_22429.p1 GENE.Phypoly_transcript_22429~~Phypoly_transcript_22429.p1  ORF type:complete len:130 (+),score=12.81 Phypoly_transcript_22429:140-529(+)